MNNKRKVCVVTGTRAEYGLLFWLMKKIAENSNFELQILATGMHLSPEFGLTYNIIEKDGFVIDKKVEMLLSSDTEVGISKSIGLGVIGFADALHDLQPDILVLLGDRFEVFSAASAATIAKIPVAHIHGGEATEGLIDEAMRHAITKMSHLHFTSTETYKKRVIQLGEQPERVFNFGAIGIDNIKKLKLLDMRDFEESIGFKLGKVNLLVTFHPVTLEHASAKSQFYNLLNALDEINASVIFTKSNADTDGRVINKMIDDYVAEHPSNTVAFTSLGQLRYLSAIQYMDAVVGNSSSGLLEVPAFKVATVNIGDRQKGRIKAESVIDCEPTTKEIFKALNKVLDPSFKEFLRSVENPYGDGGASEKIVNVLETYPLDEILKKKFFDCKFEVE